FLYSVNSKDRHPQRIQRNHDMIDLFEEKRRSHQGPASHNENPFDFYDRSARAEIAAMRNYLNKWFGDYPEFEQAELKARFMTSFSPAFFELFLYKLFQEQGFEIQIHPQIEGTRRRPDFLIRKLEHQIYVEAKEAKDTTEAQEA